MVGSYLPDCNECVMGRCRRCINVVRLGRKHDVHQCADNDRIEEPAFVNSSKRIKRHIGKVEEHKCLWMRGTVPRELLIDSEGPEIHEARIWESMNFVETSNRSGISYSDGTGGQADIVAAIRPVAFGLATFDVIYERRKLRATNISIIGGETPGGQTLPRAELFGAIILMTRVHNNVCARLGTDAAYVTEGARNRAILERGADGDLLGLFFQRLDLRQNDLQIQKVASHLERAGLHAVMGGYAELVDIIGNALADEAAERAVALLRPKQKAINAAKQTDQLANAICTRIGFIQARLCDLFGNAHIHEAPRCKEEEPLTDKAVIDKMVEDMRATGHVLERRLRGHNGNELKLHTMHDPSKSREGNRKAAVDEIRSKSGLFCVNAISVADKRISANVQSNMCLQRSLIKSSESNGNARSSTRNLHTINFLITY